MKISKISNPLTVIVAFATLTEVVGVYVLPRVSEANQSILIWFVIGFPVLLVCAFFLTLNLNHKVLYAPGDYQDDTSFLKAANVDATIEGQPPEEGIPVGSINHKAEKKNG